MKISPVCSVNDEFPEYLLDSDCIGISDPNTDTVVAMVQAVERALAFYAINQNLELSSVYEYYYLDANMDNNYNNQKSHWIAEFNTHLKGFSYEIDKMYFTDNKELVLTLDVYENVDSASEVDVSGSFMYHYDYLNDKSDYGEKIIFNITSTDLIKNLKWESTIDNDRIIKKSYINDKFHEFECENLICEYDEKMKGKMMFAENKYSLWDCFLDTFFQAISVFESESVVIESTNRQIAIDNNDEFNDKNQNIIRSVIKTRISCRHTKIILKNNVLYADWEINEI